METLSKKTQEKIENIFGKFSLMSAGYFYVDGNVRRTRITVTKPAGKKYYHFVEYENGRVA